MLPADQKKRCKSNLSTISVLANRNLHQDLTCSRGHGITVPNVCLQALTPSLPSSCDFCTLSPNREPVHMLTWKLQGVMSRGCCCFRSILCLSQFLVPLPRHKMLLQISEEDIREISSRSTNQNNFGRDFCRHTITVKLRKPMNT